MKRRNFIKNVGILAGLCGLYSWRVEPYWLDVEHVEMRVKNLPKNLDGKTLMQVSDIHVGNGFDKDFLKRSFDRVRKYEPDFVAYTGDFVTWHNDEQLAQLGDVLENCARGKIGTVGILGNHDYGTHWRQNDVADAVSKVAENAGITVLRNEQKDIGGLTFTGFEDLWSDRFGFELTENIDAAKANIVLCHNPDACDLKIWNEYKGWILSGHTHGGQVKIPFVKTPIVPVNNKRYTSGKIDLYDGRILYINKGLSTSHYVRFGVRPEITIFKLKEKSN